MVTKSLVEVPFSVHGLIFIESVRGPLSIWPKTYPFFPILPVFAPLNDIRVYIACMVLKNNIIFVIFFYEDDIQL